MVSEIFKLTPAEDDELSRFERAVAAERKRMALIRSSHRRRAIEYRLAMAWRDKLKHDQFVDGMREISTRMRLAEESGLLDLLVKL
ncbi:MAG: hypothetical protein HQM00_11715 [Magnetococcales bacterium]|nr:hypothetical protein [Magnetococcales bacterium]